MNSMPRTLRSHLTRALVKSFILCSAIAAFMIGASLLTLPTTTPVPHSQGQVEGQVGAPAKGSPSAVWAEHKGSCWRGDDEAKADTPSAAIIQKVGGGTVYTKNPALVSSASDEVMASIGYGDHEDARFEVIALCI